MLEELEAAYYECEAQRLKDSLFEFFCEAWKIIEPDTPLNKGWHLEKLSEVLENILYRIRDKKPREKDTVINIPPNTTKSSLITIVFPVWCWVHVPSMRFITSSYNEGLALLHATKSRDIITSDWFQDLYGNLFTLKYDNNKKSEYANDKTGIRIAVGTGTSVVGKHGDILIGDDNASPKAVESEAKLQGINRWWDTSFSPRLREPKVSQKIAVMQRLGVDDLTGHLIKEKKDTYEHYCLPATLSDEVKPAAWKKFYKDGLLDPVRLDAEVLASMKIALGSLEYAGQYDQLPAPASGNLVDKDWFGTFRLTTLEETAFDDYSHLVWNFCIDGAYTEKLINAPTALIAWCYYKRNMYVRDVTEVWMELPALLKFIPDYVKRHGYSNESAIYIEPKASGMSAAQMLLAKTPLNVILDKEPRGDKVVRLKSKLAFIEAGRIRLLFGANWIKNYVEQLAHFPNTKYKDMTDVTTMAIDRCEDYVEGGSVLGIRAV